MGFLIAIEGVDASGKQTHTALLKEHLSTLGINARQLDFPMYDSDSSAGVRMYLNGELGEHADDISAYAASTLFAADRFLSYKKDWQKDYNNGGVILCDRYVSSNMIHQACKLDGAERDKFLDWLFEFEHGIYALPQADITLFLDMPPEFSRKIIETRNNKINNSEQKDIHERDAGYLDRSYNTACAVAERFGWTRISSVYGGELRLIEDISSELCSYVDSALQKAGYLK